MPIYYHFQVFFDVCDPKGAHKFYSTRSFASFSAAAEYHEKTFTEYAANGYVVDRSGILYWRECVGVSKPLDPYF